MPATRELAAAQAWMDQHVGAGIEGVVVKERGRGYRPWSAWLGRPMRKLSSSGVAGTMVTAAP